MITFERMKKALLLIGLNLSLSLAASAQVNFSISTGGVVLRNFSPQQKFWAVGQTIRGDIHFALKQSAMPHSTIIQRAGLEIILRLLQIQCY
jgi:hypothetical protein